MTGITQQSKPSASLNDLQRIWSWNARVPAAAESTVHDIFARTARQKPGKLAIFAHDGDWTYKELNEHSTNLAKYLVANGIGKEHVVPICFEKSRYTALAALAVMKSGAASVLLDPSQPQDRLLSITSQISSPIILCSESLRQLAGNITPESSTITVVGNDSLADLCLCHQEAKLPEVFPSDRLYVIFTSGTTGTPKGAIITHSNYASAILHQRDAHGFTSNSRVYDFSSYAFDVSWSNLIHTLTVGASLIIPSETERRDDLAGSIIRHGATHVDITPSIARILPDSVLERIDTLVLGGEKLTAEHGKHWSKLVKQLKNPYGPSECTPTATITTVDPGAEYTGSIGKGLGLNTWVVDAQNANSLVSIGEIGELLLEGPLVGDGYLDEAKNAAAFVVDPAFLVNGIPDTQYSGRKARLYKTGDLVRYEEETGNLIFIGRKDSQVKINGQRVELSDIEHHIRQHVPTEIVQDVAAEMIKPSNSDTKVLVAFLAMKENAKLGEDAQDLNVQLSAITDGLTERLLSVMPVYMVPSLYLPLRSFPLTQNGKTDRRGLRSIAEITNLTDLAKSSASRGTRRAPDSPKQMKLLRLWSTVLAVDESDLGLDDSFVKLGGDSIAAMRLVSQARACGLSLTVSDIFLHPQLEDMSKFLGDISNASNAEYGRLSLLSSDVAPESVIEEASALCGVAPSDVEDIIPCTPLQEGLMSLSAKRDGDYIVRYLLKLQPEVNLDRLCKAWDIVLATTPILRTRIVNIRGQGLVQIILRPGHQIAALSCANLSTLETLDCQKNKIGMGTSLGYFQLATGDSCRAEVYFVWEMHHAIYDGWSVKLMIERLEKAYLTERSDDTSISNFHPFISYIRSIDGDNATEFWKQQSAGIESQVFPPLPSPGYQPKADSLHECTIERIKWPVEGATAPSALRAALALLLSLYTDTRDAAFGAVTSGRQASVPELDTLVGPTIATVPVRVGVDKHQQVEDFLESLHGQSLRTIEFEQLGLHNIRRVSSDAERLCSFQTLLVVQPPEIKDEHGCRVFVNANADLHAGDVAGAAELGTYALTVECQLEDNAVSVRVMFDSNVIGKQEIQRFSHQFEHILRQICEKANISRKLSDISILSENDQRDIWNWNGAVPEPYDVCVHDLIERTALRQPTAPAICAWDGDFSYAELNTLATKVAVQLSQFPVANTILPILFEKSKWTSVAMLAAIKAGAAFVAMDVSQPEERLRSIVAQVNPVAILSSVRNSPLAKRLTSVENVVLTSDSVISLPHSQARLPIVSPSSRLYLVFTSGSTGTPKGVVISHSNFSSAIRYQQDAHGFDQNSRVYDFASYAFDVSLSNFFHTLTIGACLCVPSDADRRDDLAGSLGRFQATHADLTPSAASVLPEESIKQLKTLVLGGEKLSVDNARYWSSLVSLKNPYGPSECTPTATLQNITPSDAFSASIGKGLGLNTWVVDTVRGQSLVPIGAIGELLLEGPLVGKGYHGDELKTRAAFLENVEFLAHGAPDRPGRAGRLYRTGDLVRYNSDGSLSFVGRKDAQVKINGQRVELSDIESHMSHNPNIRQAACAYPKSGLFSNKLVGFFSLEKLDSPKSRNEIELLPAVHQKIVQSEIGALEVGLRDSLPVYMVPSIWVPLQHLPLSTSGKLDSKRLWKWIENADDATFASLSAFTGTSLACRAPTTELEKILCAACSSILNIPLNAVNLNKSFIANGGDSISAMRLSAHCRSSNATFSVAQLLRSKSLADFAANGMQIAAAKPDCFREEENKLFGLSPIQQWYFEQMPETNARSPDAWCNQGFYVKLSRRFSNKAMAAAMSTLVGHHSMLRSRFRPVDGKWMQLILSHDSQDNFLYSQSSLPNLSAVSSLANSRHRELDPETGPVFSADFCSIEGQSTYLVLVAHHLVVDLVSWRIILDDLETLLSGGKLLPSLPFQTWNEQQIEYASNLDPAAVLSTSNINSNIDFWELPAERKNTVQEHRTLEISVDRDTTASIFSSVNNALNTEPVEILMAGVWQAFFATFPERSDLTIFSEGHGRESWSPDVDPSRTVGWFTSISPISMSRKAAATGLGLVRYIKDARRTLLANGWAYFNSRYLTERGREAFKRHDSIMEITFNYHGQFQQFESDEALFTNMTLHGVCEQGPVLPASSLFGVEVSMEDGLTSFSVSVNQHIAHQGRIDEWIRHIPTALKGICADLELYSGPSQTLCDYPFLSLDHGSLDKLQTAIIPELQSANHSAIENIFPCTPTVDGILISQIKDSESYKTVQRFRITSTRPEIISMELLQKSWQQVVARQPALRTVFIPSLDSASAFYKVLLEQHCALVSVIGDKEIEYTDAVALLDKLRPFDYPQNSPAHCVTLCRVSSSEVICQVEMSHAITDGASTSILQQDWVDAYTDNLRNTNLATTSEAVVRALSSVPTAVKDEYWRRKLDGAEPCHFPQISHAVENSHSLTSECRISGKLLEAIESLCASTSITVASFMQTVWALCLSAYTKTDSVVFGYLASGRDLPIAGIDEVIGAYTNMLVCRAAIDRQASGSSLLRAIHDEVMEDLDYQHSSLASIQHELTNTAEEQLFNSIVSYQRHDSSVDDMGGRITIAALDGKDPTEYAIVLNIGHTQSGIEIVLDHASNCLSESQAARLLSVLMKTCTALTSQSASLYKFDLVSDEDIADIWRWNSLHLDTFKQCVHDLITETTKLQPQAQAICAWDGCFTYEDLDALTTRLAVHLVHLGVTTGHIVPLCVEKSRWTPVMMLGVMKAGGASVVLDSSQPEDRLRSIIQQTNSNVLLCSDNSQDVAQSLAGPETSAFSIGESFFASLTESPAALPTVSPNDNLYVVFTSGSTGVPKGVVVTHANIASAIHHQRASLGFTSTSRIFDFSSYMFDVAWCNLLQGLSAGSCICIPADEDRKGDFMSAITRFNADNAIFTPSALRGHELTALNSLKHLHFIGEPLRPETFSSVHPSVSVNNLYGPTECTTFSTVLQVQGRAMTHISIGSGSGLNTWIADPVTGTSLVPIGVTGELLLEGPLVSSGYLGDEAKTNAAFVNDPQFLLDGGRGGRVYKTGDLVRYDSSGALTFVGRKDAQIKINGMRVELGDIESSVKAHLRETFNSIDVVAEVVTPQGTSRAILLAFVSFGIEVTAQMNTEELKEFTSEATRHLYDSLSAKVAAHMIPSAYVPLHEIPTTASGKTDRRRLRELAKSLSYEQLISTNTNKRRQPSTEAEIQLQKLWSSVLDVDPSLIGADDNFLRIGGDSVGAMRLVGAAREAGSMLSVANIMRHPKLSDMALLMDIEFPQMTTTVENFSLMRAVGTELEKMIQEAATICSIDVTDIEDMYPCTPLQEGLLALTARRSGDYIIRCALELNSSCDVSRFKKAWDSVVLSTPALRTRIVDLSGKGLTQVTVQHEPTWALDMTDSSLHEYTSHDEQQDFSPGSALSRYALLSASGKTYFMLTLHHAIYDGWSLDLIFDRLEKAYAGEAVEDENDYRTFVKHVESIDQSQSAGFWNAQLKDSEAQTFPSLPSLTYQPKADRRIVYDIECLDWANSDITPSSTIRAALAILIAAYLNSEQVVFGATTTGRQAAIAGIESMIGPTIATVPVHMPVQRDVLVSEFLSSIQERAIEMANYEQMGLQNIRRLNAVAERLCDFQTLLIVQPTHESAERQSNIIVQDAYESGGDDELQDSATYALTLECLLNHNGMKIKMNFDSGVIDERQSNRFLLQLEHVVRQLSQPKPDQRVGNISCVSPHDAEELWEWNETVPETVQKCVHDLIADTSRQQPEKQAVCAWDGNWSYGELEQLSNNLAHHLVDYGIKPGHIIPLLFEKSRWMPIAMIAAMKAGAASVAVDTSQPEDRLRSILGQVNAPLILCSSSQRDLANTLRETSISVVVVGDASAPSASLAKAAEPLPRVHPSSLLYLVFTSGSTGTPKGVMITHSNFSSAIAHQKLAQGILPSSRVLDFASYAFDVAWANPLLTFEAGGTLCIPSDSDRKDDLNGSIYRLKPTHADLTPSAALVLSDQSLKLLHSLTLGGERLAASCAEQWAAFPNLRVKNSYGPSECTPTSTFTDAITAENAQSNSIGQAYGLNTWVADAVTGQTLVPIGGIGELLLEGPLVGDGYFGDDEKTAAAFVSNPQFLHNGPQGEERQGRVYRTGDLVKYNSDGSVAFVGRKDAQVKINGQRVELSEIESHIGRYQATHDCILSFPSSGHCAKRLVCVVQFKGIKMEDNLSPSAGICLAASQHDDAVSAHLSALQELLHAALPRYMVPSIWVAVANIPMTTSGKQDRRLVNTWVTEMSPEVFARIDNSDTDAIVREPTTDMECIIRDVCSTVLNVPQEKVNLDRSFIANGGDSISAMRLASQLRLVNIACSVTELLQSKTLTEFAHSAKTANALTSFAENYNTFPLSPIQQWYFDQDPPIDASGTEGFYNQGFYVKVMQDIPTDEITKAISTVVEGHSMLRARFEKLDGVWKQRILPATTDAYYVELAAYDSLDAIKVLAQERQRKIDIENGPVFSADICDLDGAQYLILVAHHLVIDLVSWRIILDDLKALLQSVPLPQAMPFQTWNELQTEKAKSIIPASTLSTTGICNNLDFWSHASQAGPVPNTLSDHDTVHITIDEQTTSLLLGAANPTLNTEPVELLLASVWHSFLTVFSEREGLTIFNEGHGREAWSTEIDLSRTVGWFTTLSPSHITRADSIPKLVRAIKDARRQLSSNGWAYFTSRYLNETGKKLFTTHNTDMEVVFNYHGQFQQLEEEAALFEDISFEGVSEQGYYFPATSFFNIEVAIERGQTFFDFSFNRHIAHQERIKNWASEISSSLQLICHELVNCQPSRTLCDFNFISLDYSALDMLQKEILPEIEELNKASVEDILPCSPTVDGMLLSQLKQADAYKTKQIYEITAPEGHSLDVMAAVDAWQSVVAHQPALRTVFINGQVGGSAFNQVILTKHSGNVILLSAPDADSALAELRDIPDVEYVQSLPPHRTILCQTPDRIFWQLEMSHAITDGSSAAILEQNFVDSYNGQSLTTDMISTMREYSTALSSTDPAAKAAYWREKLSGTEPCQFPSLSGLSQSSDGRSEELTISLQTAQVGRIMKFCAAHLVTPASLLKSAWAVTLAAYTGRSSVCFGYLASGRDFDVPNLHESVGAYTNMMVFRADIGSDFSGSNFVRQAHEQLMEDLGYQHCSLAGMQHDLGVSSEHQLFNSIVSYQKLAQASQEHDCHSISLRSIDGDDPTEYKIGLGINHGPQEIEFDLNYSPSSMSENQALRVLSYLVSTIDVLVDGGQLLSLCSEDLREIWSWNATVPEAQDICVHELISATAARQPDSPAVCAWDGDFSYRELDQLSTRLAQHLVELGITFESVVPHCVAKSKWASVATLAVMKAGGASVTLDVNQPLERLQSIVGQITSPVILASTGQEELAKKLHHGRLVLVDEKKVYSYAESEHLPLPRVDTSNRLYINFTSGTTGVPKGVAITHSNYSSAIKHQQTAHEFKPTSRVFDFASQSFDVSWSNFCHTFTIGACLCVPSEDERKNDAAGAIRRMRVTHADMTPSAISTLPLETLSQLETIVLGGEKLSAENARSWSALTRVLNPYGPCECTPTSTITEIKASQAESGNISIGRGLGLNTWIVDAANGDTLVPIGVVGELVLEGPLVGDYLGDTTRSSAFITGAPFLARGAPGHTGRASRMYKTGDLVRYNTDGSLVFVGRKDGQVKINGQRVELADIESHVESCMASSSGVQVVAEVITPKNMRKAILVAFASLGGLQSRNMEEPEFVDFVKQAACGIEERLAKKLPSYMIPAAYIPVLSFPITAAGKTDRRQLRAMGAGLTREQLLTAGGSEAIYREPSGATEIALQKLWAMVLNIEPESISAVDNFLKLGGDSITAMRLVSAARDAGFLISVANILTSKTLCDQALLLKVMDQNVKQDLVTYKPFSLLHPSVSDDRETIYAQLSELGIRSDTVEDIMPVTDHQARCIALTHSATRNLLLYQTMDGSGVPNISKMRATCAALVERFDLLRTVFIAHNDAFLQVVLREIDVYVPVFTIHDDTTFDERTEDVRRHDLTSNIPFGRPLTRISIVHNVPKQSYRIIVRMSHAQHDGMSLVKMWDAFEEMYQEALACSTPIAARPEEIRQASFSNYMFALSRINKKHAVEYWTGLLHGARMTTLAKPTTYTLSYGDGQSITVEIPRSSVDGGQFTFSTVLKAAWSYTLAQATAEDDVVFGNLTHGRSLPGVDNVFGACVNIIPTRVKFRRGWTARDLISFVNSQQLASMQHENLGTRSIVRGCTSWASWSFAGTVVYHHNFEDPSEGDSDRGMHAEEDVDLSLGDLDMVDIHVTSKAQRSCYRIELSFGPGLLTDSEAQKLSNRLRDTTILFHQALDTPLPMPSASLAAAPVVSEPRDTTEDIPENDSVHLDRQFSAEAKSALQDAWSRTLNKSVPVESSKPLNFFASGGDLVAASLLAAHMELKGYSLSVEEIVKHPDLNSQLAIIENWL